MRPPRGLGDAPVAAASRGIALLFGLAPGRACLVSPRRTGLVSVALFLASRRTGVTRYPASWSSDFPHGTAARAAPRAIVRLTRQPSTILPALEETGREQAADPLARAGAPVEGGVGEGIGDPVLRPRDVARAPALQAGEPLQGCPIERRELRVADPLAPRQLLDDELRIEAQLHLAGTEPFRGFKSENERHVLGHVVGRDPERLADGSHRRGALATGRVSVEQDGAGGGGPGIAPRGPVGAHDQPRDPVRPRGPAQPGFSARPVVPSPFRSAFLLPRPLPRPVSRRQAIWRGSKDSSATRSLSGMIALSVILMCSGQTSVQHLVMLHRPIPPLSLRYSRRSPWSIGCISSPAARTR